METNKCFRIEMHTVEPDEIQGLIKDEGGRLLTSVYTNHTDSAFNGKLRCFDEIDLYSGYVSQMFVVGK